MITCTGITNKEKWLDAAAYMAGFNIGRPNVILSDDNQYTFTDANTDGNIVITETEAET